MKKAYIALILIIQLFSTLTAFSDYAGDGKEFEWKESEQESRSPKILGFWSDDDSYYSFKAAGTYEAYFSASQTYKKGFWKENKEGKVYFCNDAKISVSSVYTYVGYVDGANFYRDHICYRDTYTKKTEPSATGQRR
jgi:hypothetical protein